MKAAQNEHQWFSIRLSVLPALFLATLILTIVISRWTPGGAYYRIEGIAPLAGVFGMASDSTIVLLSAYLLSGTPWWYLVGWIGWSARKRSISRLKAALGAVIALFTVVITFSMTYEVLKQDARDSFLTGTVIFQYSLVAVLCFGALASALYAGAAAILPRFKPEES